MKKIMALFLGLVLSLMIYANPIDEKIIVYNMKYSDSSFIQNPEIQIFRVRKYLDSMIKDFNAIEIEIIKQGLEDEYRLWALKNNHKWEVNKISERLEELKRKRNEFFIWFSFLVSGIIAIELCI